MLECLGSAVQIGVVTNDLQQSIRDWVNATDVAPFAIVPEISLVCIDADGGRTEMRVAVALGFHAATMIELIQPLDDGNSFYHERLVCGPHLHHLGFWPCDMEGAVAACKARGWRLRARVEVNGRPPTSFFEFPPVPSTLIELIEGGSAKLASYEPIRNRARMIASKRREERPSNFDFRHANTVLPHED